jgi:hypothetical protein
MAILRGGILGNFSGKIGGFNARIVNGTTILCARPKHQKVSNSPKSIENRQKFAVTIAFAKIVSSLPALHEIWMLNKGSKGSVFNSIFKHNLYLSSTKAPTLNNIITPEGFESPVLMVEIFAGKLIGSLDKLDSVALISPEETNLSINAVIALTDPKDDNDPFNKVIPISKEVAGFEFNKQCDFEIDLSIVDASLIKKYNQKIIYLAVATKTTNGKVIQYSRSYSKLTD